MSASTVSLTANPTAAIRRTPVISGDKKSTLDFPPSESHANTNQDPIRGEAAADRSNSYDAGPVIRKSGSSTAAGTKSTTTQRRTRKVQGTKNEKTPWTRVVRVFAKQLGALLLLAGLIQLVRKVVIKETTLSSYSSFPIETEMGLSELESRIAAVDGLVKTTTKMMQVQVEFLDKKMGGETRALRETMESTSSALEDELKKVDSKVERLQASVEEVNSKSLVSREELERVYEELKKSKVDESSFSDVSIDELRAYAREIVEKEIGKHAADGLGRVDYALASGGAFVMDHSDPFLVGNWFGTSRRRVHSKAVKMLTPSFGEPGQCFPLKGSDGFVQVRLRAPVVPEAVTLEHVSKAVAYDRTSAPKDCRVSGWLEDKDMESETRLLLTEFSYDLDRSNAQTFDIAESAHSGLVNTVRLDFTSNHGSDSHTCIYRFRVHGRELDSVSATCYQTPPYLVIFLYRRSLPHLGSSSTLLLRLSSIPYERIKNITRSQSAKSFTDNLTAIKEAVSKMTGRDTEEVRVVVAPYRICPLGAHIDHQGGAVSAMTINKGILLGFVPSGDTQVQLRSAQFEGEVCFRVDEIQHPVGLANKNGAPKDQSIWGTYARGALYALQTSNKNVKQGIVGCISGSDGLDSSGLSSSAAVGVAYLLALENANELTVSATENIEYDRLIENGYLGLRNGILDQSAILLSSYGCLTYMDCKTMDHKLIQGPELEKPFRILLAFSGLRQALTTNPGYNLRVAECQEAAKVLLTASGKSELEPTLCNGLEAWATGNLEEFGKLISASGLSSIENYECGAEPLIQLYKILLKAPGVYGARFSGAGFRGCCLAFVDAETAEEAASYVKDEYEKAQPEFAKKLNGGKPVLICEAGDSARVL
ncbi:hypothetical protein IGI04_020701 [Brassica rapa subsp. trilocularis]|uniref:SUN domain-containing protein n=1 Tax=Brassica rapa subsp. trilocularis TaxID=1813537 RepID=A0ABQ7MJH7_BRACM|nr:hypothetical protein IGI04_020701 [Brassica rapa subsp. trilocularis]